MTTSRYSLGITSLASPPRLNCLTSAIRWAAVGLSFRIERRLSAPGRNRCEHLRPMFRPEHEVAPSRYDRRAVAAEQLPHAGADPRRSRAAVERVGPRPGGRTVALRVRAALHRFSRRTADTLLDSGWRLRIAPQLLSSDKQRVGPVAETVGYAPKAALNRAFKRQFGTPPSTGAQSLTPVTIQAYGYTFV